MSCPELSSTQLWELLDNELSQSERKLVEAHLTTCRRCAALLETMRQRPLPFGHLTLAAPPAGFRERVMLRLHQEVSRPARPFVIGWVSPFLAPMRLATASAAVLALALLSVATVGSVLALRAVGGPGSLETLLNDLPAFAAPALEASVRLFGDWGWLLLLVGMLAVVLVPVLRLLRALLSDRS